MKRDQIKVVILLESKIPNQKHYMQIYKGISNQKILYLNTGLIKSTVANKLKVFAGARLAPNKIANHPIPIYTQINTIKK